MDVRLSERKRWWLTGAVLVALALLELKVRLFPHTDTPELLTAPVAVADIEQTVLAVGTIQPYKLVSVGAQASGRIVAMHVALGDPVVKDQLIAEIDPSTQQNALENAEALLAQNRAERASRLVALKQAALAFKRAKGTYALEASSQADYEAAEAAYEGAKAEVAVLDAQIKSATTAVNLARVTLGYTKVRAPMAGTVIAIVTPEGQTVNAVQSAPTVVKLADLEMMTVKAQISEADRPHVRPGQVVYFTILADPTHRYYATLRAVEPAPESMAAETATAPQSSSETPKTTAVYYNGLFEIKNPEHELQPTMTAQVNIVLGEAKGALSIPVAALGDTDANGRRQVRIVEGKSVASRWVRVGLNNTSAVQVLEGLRSGDTVVLGDSDTLQLKEAAEKRAAGTT